LPATAATASAVTTMGVYRREADGGRKDARDFGLYDIVHTSPNEDMTSFQFWQAMVASMLLRGNGYAEIHRIGTRIVALDFLLPELKRVISHCRDNVVSPFLVHRRPDRKRQKQAETKERWTKVEERYLTRAFKDAREAADCYKGWKEEEMPGFHEVRALSLHLYKKAGKDGQKIAGHASEGVTKNYQKEHAEVIWSEAIPDLDFSEIAG